MGLRAPGHGGGRDGTRSRPQCVKATAASSQPVSPSSCVPGAGVAEGVEGGGEGPVVVLEQGVDEAERHRLAARRARRRAGRSAA